MLRWTGRPARDYLKSLPESEFKYEGASAEAKDSKDLSLQDCINICQVEDAIRMQVLECRPESN